MIFDVSQNCLAVIECSLLNLALVGWWCFSALSNHKKNDALLTLAAPQHWHKGRMHTKSYRFLCVCLRENDDLTATEVLGIGVRKLSRTMSLIPRGHSSFTLYAKQKFSSNVDTYALVKTYNQPFGADNLLNVYYNTYPQPHLFFNVSMIIVLIIRIGKLKISFKLFVHKLQKCGH